MSRELRTLLLLLALPPTWLACGHTPLPPAAIEHNDRGVMLLSAGALDEAEARFRLALEFHPRFSEAHANLGLVQLERGRLQEAEAGLRQALILNRDFVQAWASLGVVLERRDDPTEAERAYLKALEIDPGHIAARRNLGLLLLGQSRFAEARDHLLRLAQVSDGELASEDSAALGALAYAELRLGRLESALARASVVLEASPTNAAARIVRASATLQRGDPLEAIADLEEATKDSRYERDARVRLAAALLLVGRAGAARAEVTRLLRFPRIDAGTHVVAGLVAEQAGATRRARVHAEEALRLRPDLEIAQRLLDRLLAGSTPRTSSARSPIRAKPRERASIAP